MHDAVLIPKTENHGQFAVGAHSTLARRRQERPELRTRIEPTLDSVSDADLQAISREGCAFASHEWFQLVQRLDLASITGGTVQIQFAVVTADGSPVAVCPLLRTRGPALYAPYSIGRYYFQYLLEQATSNKCANSKWLRMGAKVAEQLRRLLEFAGCSLDDCLIVCHPLSYRGDVPMVASADVTQADIAEELVSSLKEYAGEIDRPLCFFCLEDDAGPMQQLLPEAGFQKVFQFYDNQISVVPSFAKHV